MIRIVEFKDPHKFLPLSGQVLGQNESFYNLKLGLINGICDKKIIPKLPIYLGIENQNELTGCALRSHDDKPLAISKLSIEEVESLICFLYEDTTLVGVVGEVSTATKFRDLWIKRKNINYKLVMHLGVYEASKIIMPKINGTIFLATQNNKEILFEFICGFMEETFPQETKSSAEIYEIYERHIKNQSLYLLRNEFNEIVSMASYSRGTNTSGAVAFVYTKKAARGKGYGSLVTALVSEKILSSKKIVNLFTDLSNPTSNSIYQKIGFKKIGENVNFRFI